ncbi:MAG: phosphatidate cytidylyltransferase [Halanaerobiales bacterium]
MLAKRLISAFIGIVIFIIFIMWNSYSFAFLTLILAYSAVIEYSNMINEISQNKYILAIFSLFTIISIYFINNNIINLSYGISIFTILFIFLLYNLIFDFNNFHKKISYKFFGLVYITAGMIFLLLLRDYSTAPFNNTRAIWLVLIATWATDTGAYFTGMIFGKKKLARNISPNKTIEGAVGGLLLCTLVISFYTLYLDVFSFYWFIYGIMVSFIAMAGDLFESSIKRSVGIKDTGNIIPGHGGVLDRFDSLLFSAPFTFYFIELILNT